MDRNRIEGAAKQVRGTIRQAVGKVTGSRTTQLRGTIERMSGKVQSKVGIAADTVRDRLKK
jgi:uncharacterized protein YjbJ (UPF0337 family)